MVQRAGQVRYLKKKRCQKILIILKNTEWVQRVCSSQNLVEPVASRLLLLLDLLLWYKQRVPMW